MAVPALKEKMTVDNITHITDYLVHTTVLKRNSPKISISQLLIILTGVTCRCEDGLQYLTAFRRGLALG